MSGEGVIASANGVTVDVEPAMCLETIACERALVMAYADRHRAQIALQANLGRIERADAELISEQVRVFAEGVAIGLHTDALELRPVRVAVRAALSAAGLDGRPAA